MAKKRKKDWILTGLLTSQQTMALTGWWYQHLFTHFR
jgi:hypothetical protein